MSVSLADLTLKVEDMLYGLAQVEALIMRLSDVSDDPAVNDNNKRVH
jgi:hypothetical protein